MSRKCFLLLCVLSSICGCTEQPPADPMIETPIVTAPTVKPVAAPATSTGTSPQVYVPPAPAPIEVTGNVLGDAIKRLDATQAFRYQYQRSKSNSGVAMQATGRSNGMQTEIRQKFEGGSVEQIYIGAGQRVMLKTPEGFSFVPDGADAHNRLMEFVRFAQSAVGGANKGATDLVNGVSCDRYTASMGNQNAVIWVDPTRSQIIKVQFQTVEFGAQFFEFSDYGKVTPIEVLPTSRPTFQRG